MKIFIKFVISTIAGTFMLTGCGEKLIPVKSINNDTSKHITNKSYQIGKKELAYIGNAMIKRKDYIEHTKTSNVLKANKDFQFMGHNFFIDDVFIIEGLYKLDLELYRVVHNHKLGQFRMLINHKGVILKKVITPDVYIPSNYIAVVWAYNTTPRNVSLIQHTDTVIDTAGSSNNYELVYTGKDKESMKLLYREYTGNDLARPSYYQTLTYDLDVKKIRFKNLVMNINNLNNEKIEFVVISDD